MIKEELRKEIEKEAKRRTQGFRNQENCIQSYIMGASDFAQNTLRSRAILKKHRGRNMKKSKIYDSLWCAVGYAFSCGLNTAAACAMLATKQFWPMLICLACMIFTAHMADKNFRAVKKTLGKVEESKNESELGHDTLCS